MISKLFLFGLSGGRVAHEYEGDVFIISPTDGKPLELTEMPKIASELFRQGSRAFILIASQGDEYKTVSLVDHFAAGRNFYQPHSPAWETITPAQVEALIGEEIRD